MIALGGLLLGLAGCPGERRQPERATGTLRHARSPSPEESAPDPPRRPPPPAVTEVDELPFLYDGDTASGAAGELDSYDCGWGCCDGGRERRFPLTLEQPAILTADLEGRAADGPHLHLVTGGEPRRCIELGFERIERPLPAGDYELIVDGSEGSEGAFRLVVAALEPQPTKVGELWNTFYILADEESFSGPKTTTLYDGDCQPITKVRRAFYNSLCIQGSGVLSDGRVVNFDRRCTRSCLRAERCRRFPVAICYRVLDPERYPFGMGKAPRPLVRDWSAAVDLEVIPLDRVLYIEELDGIVPPGKTTPHDGCLATVDTGGRIEDNHIDIFAGRRDRWLAWEELLPTRSKLTAWLDHPRCFRHRLRPGGDVTRPAGAADQSR